MKKKIHLIVSLLVLSISEGRTSWDNNNDKGPEKENSKVSQVCKPFQKDENLEKDFKNLSNDVGSLEDYEGYALTTLSSLLLVKLETSFEKSRPKEFNFDLKVDPSSISEKPLLGSVYNLLCEKKDLKLLQTDFSKGIQDKLGDIDKSINEFFSEQSMLMGKRKQEVIEKNTQYFKQWKEDWLKEIENKDNEKYFQSMDKVEKFFGVTIKKDSRKGANNNTKSNNRLKQDWTEISSYKNYMENDFKRIFSKELTTKIEDSISELEVSFKNKVSDVSNLQARNKTLEEEKSTLADANKVLEDKICTLEGKILTLKGDRDRMLKEVSHYKDEVEFHKKEQEKTDQWILVAQENVKNHLQLKRKEDEKTIRKALGEFSEESSSLRYENKEYTDKIKELELKNLKLENEILKREENQSNLIQLEISQATRYTFFLNKLLTEFKRDDIKGHSLEEILKNLENYFSK